MRLLRPKHFTRVVIALLVIQLTGIIVLPAINADAKLAGTVAAQKERTQAAPLLSYADLVRLYEDKNPSGELQARLTKLLSTPFTSNEASARGVKPLKPNSQVYGRFIRVAAWNIERGVEFDAVKAAFIQDQKFFRRIQQNGEGRKGSQVTDVLSQSEALKQADIVVLNEVDWGLKRTGYRNIARELANVMGMNYAYGVEFVEVDPLTLGTETLEGETASDKAELVRNIAVDKSRTLGLHGTAILSRFPLRNVRIIRFANQGHDWYADEKKGVSTAPNISKVVQNR